MKGQEREELQAGCVQGPVSKDMCSYICYPPLCPRAGVCKKGRVCTCMLVTWIQYKPELQSHLSTCMSLRRGVHYASMCVGECLLATWI